MKLSMVLIILLFIVKGKETKMKYSIDNVKERTILYEIKINEYFELNDEVYIKIQSTEAFNLHTNEIIELSVSSIVSKVYLVKEPVFGYSKPKQ